MIGKFNLTSENAPEPDTESSMSRDLLVCNVLQKLDVPRNVIDMVAKHARTPEDSGELMYAIGMLAGFRMYRQEGSRSFSHERPTDFEAFKEEIVTYLGLKGVDKVLRQIMGQVPITYNSERRTMEIGTIVVAYDSDWNPESITGVPEGVNLDLSFTRDTESGRAWAMEDAVLGNSKFRAERLNNITFPSAHDGKVLMYRGFEKYAAKRQVVEAKIKARDNAPVQENQNFEGRNFNPKAAGFRANRASQLRAFVQPRKELKQLSETNAAIFIAWYRAYDELLERSKFILSSTYVTSRVTIPAQAVKSHVLAASIEEQRKDRAAQPDISKDEGTFHSAAVELKQVNAVQMLAKIIQDDEGRAHIDIHGAGEVGPYLYPFDEGISMTLFDIKPNANESVHSADVLGVFSKVANCAYSDAFPSKEETKKYFEAHSIPLVEKVETKTGEVTRDVFNSDWSRTFAAADSLLRVYDTLAFKFHFGNASGPNEVTDFPSKCIARIASGKDVYMTRFAQRTTNREMIILVTPCKEGEGANPGVIQAFFEQAAFATLLAGEERRMREVFEPENPIKKVDYTLMSHWAKISGGEISYIPIKLTADYTQRIPEDLDLAQFRNNALVPSKREKNNQAPRLVATYTLPEHDPVANPAPETNPEAPVADPAPEAKPDVPTSEEEEKLEDPRRKEFTTFQPVSDSDTEGSASDTSVRAAGLGRGRGLGTPPRKATPGPGSGRGKGAKSSSGSDSSDSGAGRGRGKGVTPMAR